MSQSPPRTNRRLGRIVKFGVLGIIALILGLAGLRTVEQIVRNDPSLLPPAWQVRSQFVNYETVPDADIGSVVRPNQHDWVESPDFSFLRTTDSRGFFNRDPWPATANIVLLGDSLLAGIGVGVEKSFARQVDNLLPDESVINLGMPGAGAERQYRVYRRFGVDLQPQLVVACLYLASDLSNDDRFHEWLDDPQGLDYDPYRFSYKFRHETRPQFHPMRLLENLRLYSWLQSMVEPWLWGDYWIVHRFRVPDGTELFLDRAKVQFAKGVGVTDDDSQLDPLLTSLGELRTLVEANGGSFAVMLIPSKEEIYAVPAEASRENAVAQVRRWLDEAGIPFLDLYPIFRERGRERSLYFPRDIHLNAYGNQVVAETFVAWERDLVTPGLQSSSR